MFRVNILLKGRVQGVGFRYYVKQTADAMNIVGKVWNNYDGSVEIEAYIKTKNEIEDFVAKMKKGSPMSSVKESNVVVLACDPPVEEHFEIDN
ncbi:acylphosphatase [Brachyspira pilosicoli]|uniref:acylphosphatase n=1 Tax=Brachyspira pilosicoli TaxID=52584 RepID=A0A5C8F655_BRAPL|nr:acylphosphatase [Brachyspira pilosicoli]TXJ44682.1 acylphosphatase [Brachyspira pilosicoli]